ncbi:MAG: hypothetical protein DRH12_10455 [Deltaproteobacteria bacterium]|nr:MAG: hypothetical protein DRH12_10455 [Deltaproteobacteria bacterium]
MTEQDDASHPHVFIIPVSAEWQPLSNGWKPNVPEKWKLEAEMEVNKKGGSRIFLYQDERGDYHDK